MFEYPRNGVSFDKSAQKTTVSVEADGEYTVIFVVFDGTALAKAEAETVTLSKGENDVETPFALSDGDKIFLWNNLSSVAPLCLPEIIGD